MKKTLVLAALTALLFTQCTQEKDPYLIQRGSIGHLTKKMQMKQVDSIFAMDSIVQLSTIENALGTQGETEVYEKGGAKLLLLSPKNENDPNSVITNIQIFDERFKTEKGLHVNSTFADVKANYEVEAIQNAIRSVVVFLKDSDVYITIDKKDLPASLRFDSNSKVEPTQIPDGATFKYFMLGWDAEEEPEEEKTDE
ncbi:MAG: hypothetical protein AAFP76_15200 [Bacteroidota bacterium]